MLKKLNNKFIINSLFIFDICIYIYFLFHIIIFKTVSPIDLFTGNHDSMRSINLVPYIWDQNTPIIDIVGNIILFVPLGILLQILSERNIKAILKNLLISAAISLTFESIQYIFSIGAFDTNDLILNALGGLFGILIFNGLVRLLNYEKAKKFIVIIGATLGIIVIIIFITLFSDTPLSIRHL